MFENNRRSCSAVGKKDKVKVQKADAKGTKKKSKKEEICSGEHEHADLHAVKEKILSRYPSIIITLDIHRDAIYYDNYTRVKPVAEIDGKKAAQMMIITGADGGNVTDFTDWETNLSFAVNLQKAVNDRYPKLMKPIYFCNRKYNMDITPYSLLVEMGTDVNTLEEAAFSGRLLADVLADYIKNNIKDETK